jgi:hypothetical protein
MPVCDGCGVRADEAHIQRRAERLALAKKFQPARIRVLFLDGAPPARPEDYFYHVAKDRTVRTAAARSYFDELIKSTAAVSPIEIREDSALADFQRRNFCLLSALECPFEEQTDPQAALRRAAPTAIKHVQALDPSYVVPLTSAASELIRLFGLIGWGDRLVLSNGGPFVDPYLGDPQKQATFGTAFGERIRKSLSVLP